VSSNQRNDVLGRPLEEPKWEPNEANYLAKARIKVIKAAMYIFIYLFIPYKKENRERI
jgi:hypothetical protein